MCQPKPDHTIMIRCDTIRSDTMMTGIFVFRQYAQQPEIKIKHKLHKLQLFRSGGARGVDE